MLLLILALEKKTERFLRFSHIHGYGKKKIVPRHLLGNAFQITLRNLNIDEAQLLFKYAQFGVPFSFINYYDIQRFGLPKGPLVNHIIGHYLVKSDFDSALELIAQTNGQDIVKSRITHTMLSSINPKLLQFFVEAFNSKQWNKEASRIVKAASQKAGKVFPLSPEFILWLPNNVDTTQIIPVLSTNSFSWIGVNDVRAETKSRSTVVATRVFAEDIAEDEYYPRKATLTLHFLLPSGAYATMLIRQLLWKHNILLA